MSMKHIMLEGRLGRDAEIKTTARTRTEKKLLNGIPFLLSRKTTQVSSQST